IGWMTVTLLTPPTDHGTLESFHGVIRPMGNGWAGAGLGLSEEDRSADSPAAAFLAWFLGVTVVYGAVLGTGYLLYGRTALAAICLGAAAVASVALLKTLPRVGLT
ncbi:MAG: Na+:solute symporter, partial [Longimicrobiales bacterium]